MADRKHSCSMDDCPQPVLAKGLCRRHYNTNQARIKRAERRAVSRPCVVCAADLAGRRIGTIYCSTDCRNRARLQKYWSSVEPVRTGRKCKQCGGDVDPGRRRSAEFCSRPCVDKYNGSQETLRRRDTKAAQPLRPCLHCGGDIPSLKRADAKYCSANCMTAACRKRWAASAKANGYGRLRQFGIDQKTFDELLESQGDSCAICRTDEWPGNGPHLDHCHETGRIRGVLCVTCNSGLGLFKDRTDLLEAAIAYLKTQTAPVQAVS